MQNINTKINKLVNRVLNKNYGSGPFPITAYRIVQIFDMGWEGCSYSVEQWIADFINPMGTGTHGGVFSVNIEITTEAGTKYPDFHINEFLPNATNMKESEIQATFGYLDVDPKDRLQVGPIPYSPEPAVEVTEKEMEVINAIINADHSSDGHGFCGYLIHEEWDMKVLRGVMASLSKKGIAHFEVTDMKYTHGVDPSTWGSIDSGHQVEVGRSDLSQYTEDEKNTIEWTGYKLTNIKTKGAK